MYSYGPPHMAKQKLDNQLEHTYSSYVRIRDVALKTHQKRWMIGRSGKRGSGIYVLVAWHDDDDDIYYMVVSVTLGFMHFAFFRLGEGFPKITINMVNFCQKWAVIHMYVGLSLYVCVSRFVYYWVLFCLCMCCCLCIHIYVCLRIHCHAPFHVFTYFRCLLLGRSKTKKGCVGSEEWVKMSWGNGSLQSEWFLFLFSYLILC